MARELTAFTVRLEPEIVEMLDEQAGDAGVSRSDYIARLITKDSDNPAPKFVGDVEAATVKDLRDNAFFSGHPMADALRAMCISLARSMDRFSAKQNFPSIAKELRETFDALTGWETEPDDDNAPNLSAPVLDEEDEG